MYEQIANKLRDCKKLGPKITPELVGSQFNILEAFEILKRVEPVFKDGLVSTHDTLKAIQGTVEFNVISIFYRLPVNQIPEAVTNKELAKTFGPFVPKLMLAMKETHDIDYEQWDKSEAAIIYALGKPLEHLVLLKSNVIWTMDEQISMLNSLRTKSTGTTLLLYKNSNPAVMAFEELWGINTRPLGALGCMSAVPSIILQWWQAREETRLPGRMILHPYNWEEVPESISITELENKQDLPVNSCNDLNV